MAKSKSGNVIRIRGAREHNLKNIDVDIPRDKLVVITGLSGSGKSTLAFDTVYAEGQRRYVESLSTYARQFLDQLQKPDVESIDGLAPTIAIQQQSGSSNPRSTVATTTEIYDYLRVLFARIGVPHCPKCDRIIEGQSAEQIVERLLTFPEGLRLSLLAPVVRGKKGEHRDIFASAKREGFTRLRVDGEMVGVEDVKPLSKTFKHDVEVVIDRLLLKASARSRLTESVELGLKVGEGLLIGMLQKEKNSKPEEHLFSENYACPVHGVGLEELSPRMFSFNSPYGACPECAGLGNKLEVDVELLMPDRKLSIQDGLIKNLYRLGYNYGMWFGRAVKRYCQQNDVPLDTPLKNLEPTFLKGLLYGGAQDNAQNKGSGKGRGRWRGRGKGGGFSGLVPALSHRFRETDSEYVKQRIHRFMAAHSCPGCDGARLRKEVLAVRIHEKNIRDVVGYTILAANDFFKSLPLKGEQRKIAAPILKEIRSRLGFLQDVGLDYLTLDRTRGTLSGGEAQRIRLASQVGSKLVGVTYVLDEPTIGLHQRDNDRLLNTLCALRDLGNTVLVVEHDEDVMARSDWLIDLGPKAGEHGGEIIGEGTVKTLMRNPKSLTGNFLSGKRVISIPETRRSVRSKKIIAIRGAKENNLKSLDVDIPLGCLVCVTGVSGSGKSSLVNEVLFKNMSRTLNKARIKVGACKSVAVKGGEIDKVIEIDQAPIGRTPRSNPATYSGVFDEIRKLYALIPEAKIRGYKMGRFSFNVKGGRCENCQGQGQRVIEMHFLADVYVECEQCKGTRFNRETLDVKFRGLSVADVLNLPIEKALEQFVNHPKIHAVLKTLCDVGLGYVRLGQSSTTLSGGEAQRIKLAFELSKRATGNTLYILDEPTTGLHFSDISRLMQVLQKLVSTGNTVVVIEHNLDVIKQADWILDLGPEGGEAGGQLVAQGTPEDIAQSGKGFTGAYLKRVLKKKVAKKVAKKKAKKKKKS